MTDKTFKILLEFFHEHFEIFCLLPQDTKEKFYRRLYDHVNGR